MQEFVLDTSSSFYIGSISFESELLYRALTGASFAIDMDGYNSNLPESTCLVLLAKLNFVRSGFVFRDRTRASPDSQSRRRLAPLDMTDLPNYSTQTPLTRCILDIARQRSCSDERDRIYGMLSVLCIGKELAIIPDYTI